MRFRSHTDSYLSISARYALAGFALSPLRVFNKALAFSISASQLKC